MSTVQYRHWRAGDDRHVMRLLEPTGWCTPERYAAKFEDPGLRPDDILIAEQEGQVAGHLMLPHRRLRFDDTSLPVGGIGMVVVDPATRGQGIGAHLLDAALSHHRAAGNMLAGLFTQPSLVPAYAMYQRRGFVPVTQRTTLSLPASALEPAPGLQARPLQERDGPAVTQLYEMWAREHRGMSAELTPPPGTTQWIVADADGGIAGSFVVAERPEGRQPSRVMVAPSIPAAAVLAAGLAAGALEVRGGEVQLITNTRNRLHRELAPLASREERGEGTLMFVLLRLAPVVAGLSLDVSRRLRAAAAPPVAATLQRRETGEQIYISWASQVLTISDPPANDGLPVVISDEALIAGLMGQPPAPPTPALAALWSALFPLRSIEMDFINCW